MAKSKARITGRAFEDLVYRIYKELEPQATIKQNDRIKGLNSGIEREIDVSVRDKIANHEILLIIQAKDFRRSADINIVETFAGVIQDVRANRGILICNAGFTKGAKQLARNKGIDLMSAHDANEADWRNEIKIPVTRSHLTISYKIYAPVTITKEVKEKTLLTGLRLKILEGPDGLIMTKPDGSQTSFISEFLELWKDGKIEKRPGTFKVLFDAYFDWFEEKDLFDLKNGEMEYEVKVRHYLKFFTPSDYRGLQDYVTEKFTPSFIQIEGALPFSTDKTWIYVQDLSTLALDPVRLEVDVVDIYNKRFMQARWIT